MRISLIGLAAVGALALGGCAYDNYGYGGYYGGGGYYGDYGYGSPYYGYGAPYFGWYDDFYYPGAGIYVYDSGRNGRVWSDRQRTYWTSRRQATTKTMGNRTFQENWSGFRRRSH